MSNFPTRWITTASVAALLTAGMGTPASAVVTAEDNPAEAAASAQVSSFLAQNPVPFNAPGSSPAQYAAYKTAIAKYWAEVPWSAVYGHWGCTVTSVDQEQQQSDGDTVPVLTIVSNCVGDAVANMFAGLLKPRAVVEQSAEYRAAKAVSTTSGDRPATPTVSAVGPKCQPSYPFSQCLGSDHPGDIYAQTRNGDFNGWTLTVRLGQLSPGHCSLGTYKASAGPRDVAGGSSITVHSTTNVNSNWSNATTTRLTSTPTIRCAII